MAERMEPQVHELSERLQGVDGEAAEAVELDESEEGSDIHSIWKNDVRNFQELIHELSILQKQLSEAHERALSEVRGHGRTEAFPRLPQKMQDTPSPPNDAELMDLPEIRSRLSQTRTSLSAADRVQLVMRAAQSFEEHVRKETDNEVSRFQIRDIFEYSDIELLDLKKKAITRNTSEVHAFGEGKLEPGLLRSKSSLEVQEHKLSMTWNERFPLHPSSRPRIFWDFCAMFFLCYDLVIIPMQVFEMPQSAFLEALSMTCTIYWTLDIGASMNTAVFINGKLVSDSRRICRQYAITWMTLDVMLVLGDWTTVILGTGAADPMSLARTLRTGRVVRMLRLTRLLRFMKMKRLVDDVKRRASTELVLFVINVIQLFLSTALLTHVLACVWYLLGSSETDGWVHTEGLVGNDLGTIYLMSMQWSLSRLHPISLRDNMKLKLPQE